MAPSCLLFLVYIHFLKWLWTVRLGHVWEVKRASSMSWYLVSFSRISCKRACASWVFWPSKRGGILGGRAWESLPERAQTQARARTHTCLLSCVKSLKSLGGI